MDWDYTINIHNKYICFLLKIYRECIFMVISRSAHLLYIVDRMDVLLFI